MPAESPILRAILLAFGRGTSRLFRANAGAAWTGGPVERARDCIVIHRPRRFHGMPAGTSDAIGWQSVVVTPDMVGKRVALFVAVEVKAPDGRVRAAQARFIRAVQQAGGLAGVARSTEDAAAIISGKNADDARAHARATPTKRLRSRAK